MELGEWDVVLRLVLATLIGAAVGLDREVRGKPAGLKTLSLVALGAAVATAVAAQLAGSDSQAVSRVIQGVLAGVGFLGGGAILKSDEREKVSGLTTAASIWVVAALGVACGAAMWRIALTAVVLALVVLFLGYPIEDRLRRTVGKREHETRS